MKPIPEENRGIFSSTWAVVFKKTTNWYFTFAPLTIAYLTLAIYLMFTYHPVSRFFAVPPNSVNALFPDLIFVMTPLFSLIGWYLLRFNKIQKKLRRDFVADFDGSELIQSKLNRNLVYHVLEREDRGNQVKVQVVWTPDGRKRDGKIYEIVAEMNLTKFDTVRFLNS